jgi:hypothetical protein
LSNPFPFVVDQRHLVLIQNATDSTASRLPFPGLKPAIDSDAVCADRLGRMVGFSFRR